LTGGAALPAATGLARAATLATATRLTRSAALATGLSARAGLSGATALPRAAPGAGTARVPSGRGRVSACAGEDADAGEHHHHQAPFLCDPADWRLMHDGSGGKGYQEHLSPRTTQRRRQVEVRSPAVDKAHELQLGTQAHVGVAPHAAGSAMHWKTPGMGNPGVSVCAQYSLPCVQK